MRQLFFNTLACILLLSIFRPFAYAEDEDILRVKALSRRWPVAVWNSPTSNDRVVHMAFPPLIDYVRKGDKSESIFRPLIDWRKTDGYEESSDFIWPFFSSREVYGDHSMFAGLSCLRFTNEANGDYHHEIMPFYMSEKKSFGPEEEPRISSGFWPVVGRWHSKFGRDRVRFLFWPLYADSLIGNREYQYFIWPVFARYKLDGKTIGGRLFPLCGWSRTEHISKNFFLWPFFNWQSSTDPDFPESGFWFFPFMGAYQNPEKRERYFFWPLFSQRTTTEKDEKLYVNNILWPVGRRVERNDEICGWDVWPIAGTLKLKNKKKNYFLWPLYIHSRAQLGEKKVNRYQSLTYVSEKTDTAEEEDTYRFFWPLFEYAKTKNKESGKYSKKFSFLCLWPSRKSRAAEAFYNPLLRFCQYERTLKKNYRFRLLWGLIRYDRWPGGSNTGFAFFNITRKRKD